MSVMVLFSVRPDGSKLTPVVVFNRRKETELNIKHYEGTLFPTMKRNGSIKYD
jgi:hypothetical protein